MANYRHIRATNKKERNATIAYNLEGSNVDIAFAIASKKDDFNKAKGREIATGRLKTIDRNKILLPFQVGKSFVVTGRRISVRNFPKNGLFDVSVLDGNTIQISFRQKEQLTATAN